MKKAIFNKRGTRQLIDSGYKLFDKQTNCICTGNVYANTQYSAIIRPYSQTRCNWTDFEPGQLMNTDLKPFRRYGIPNFMYDILTDQTRAESLILYMFFVTDSNMDIRPVVWVLTDKKHQLIKCTAAHRHGTSWTKTNQVLTAVLPYITSQLELQHKAVGRGYIRKGRGYDEVYKGRFGTGYKRHIPTPNSGIKGNSYHFIEYWIDKNV